MIRLKLGLYRDWSCSIKSVNLMENLSANKQDKKSKYKCF